jgi:hypothetical protein
VVEGVRLGAARVGRAFERLQCELFRQGLSLRVALAADGLLYRKPAANPKTAGARGFHGTGRDARDGENPTLCADYFSNRWRARSV